DLAIEQGRQAVARQELELLGDGIDMGDTALALREPQIRAIRARIEAAKANVLQAQLELDRTAVVAPFDAKVLTRQANIGSQVSPGQTLGRIVGIDEYWIEAGVPLRDLPSIDFGESDGSDVRVRQTGWPADMARAGKVSRLIGRVDDESRLARVIVSVPNPLARGANDSEGATAPPLVLGTVVELSIAARPLENVIRLDRDHLRRDDTVWIMAEGKLDVRDVEVAFEEQDAVYISAGLSSGEEVVTTPLATVTPGVELRRINNNDENKDAEEPA
ncbi:MAG: efflux RND transporter periplasmic adaptor subunit, partial [Planctomycetota bacterium]